MSHHRFTASKLGLADACPPSHALDWVDEESGEAAIRGTGIHAALEQVPSLGIDAAVAGLPAEWARVARAVAATPWIAPLLEPGAAATELALAWDPAADTARSLGTGRGTYASAAPGEIVGTGDLIAVTDKSVIVVDYKSGRRAVAHPSRNHQLRFLALAACRAFGRDQATIALAYARDDEDAVVVSAELDCLDLESVADEVRSIAARVQAVRLDEAATYKRGEHCHPYCPARTGCPAWTGLIRHVARNPSDVIAQTQRAVSMGTIAEAWRMISEADKAIGMAKAEVIRLAYATPVQLGEGRYLGLAAGSERVVDAEKVHEVLVRVAGAAVAEKAVTSEVVTSATKGGIEKALKGLPLKDREPVYEALRQAGALARKPTVRECGADELVAPPPMEAKQPAVPAEGTAAA